MGSSNELIVEEIENSALNLQAAVMRFSLLKEKRKWENNEKKCGDMRWAEIYVMEGGIIL